MDKGYDHSVLLVYSSLFIQEGFRATNSYDNNYRQFKHTYIVVQNHQHCFTSTHHFNTVLNYLTCSVTTFIEFSTLFLFYQILNDMNRAHHTCKTDEFIACVHFVTKCNRMSYSHYSNHLHKKFIY